MEEEGDANLRDYHEFVAAGEEDAERTIIVYYKGKANLIAHQYNIVAKFQFHYQDEATNFIKGWF